MPLVLAASGYGLASVGMWWLSWSASGIVAGAGLHLTASTAWQIYVAKRTGRASASLAFALQQATLGPLLVVTAFL